MTLLLTVIAAVTSTAVWYGSARARKLNVSWLCFMFWGASIMWFVDALYEYLEIKAEYFTPAPADMLNDTFLGLSVIALALTIWIVSVLIRDPEGILKRAILRNHEM